MRISTVSELRDHATGLLRSKDPILVTRRGRLAGLFFPWPEQTLPMEFKRLLFSVLSAEVGREVAKRGLAETCRQECRHGTRGRVRYGQPARLHGYRRPAGP